MDFTYFRILWIRRLRNTMGDKLPSCPRPTKDQKAKRVKMAITVDESLYNMLQELYQEGYSVSHVIDSAIWVHLGRPKLSFEVSPSSKSKKVKEAPLFDQSQKCCGE
jgi:predicted CopG family antitoxin